MPIPIGSTFKVVFYISVAYDQESQHTIPLSYLKEHVYMLDFTNIQFDAKVCIIVVWLCGFFNACAYVSILF